MTNENHIICNRKANQNLGILLQSRPTPCQKEVEGLLPAEVGVTPQTWRLASVPTVYQEREPLLLFDLCLHVDSANKHMRRL